MDGRSTEVIALRCNTPATLPRSILLTASTTNQHAPTTTTTNDWRQTLLIPCAHHSSLIQYTFKDEAHGFQKRIIISSLGVQNGAVASAEIRTNVTLSEFNNWELKEMVVFSSMRLSIESWLLLEVNRGFNCIVLNHAKHNKQEHFLSIVCAPLRGQYKKLKATTLSPVVFSKALCMVARSVQGRQFLAHLLVIHHLS